jgi:hypothetical protein
MICHTPAEAATRGLASREYLNTYRLRPRRALFSPLSTTLPDSRRTVRPDVRHPGVRADRERTRRNVREQAHSGAGSPPVLLQGRSSGNPARSFEPVGPAGSAHVSRIVNRLLPGVLLARRHLQVQRYPSSACRLHSETSLIAPRRDASPGSLYESELPLTEDVCQTK